MIAVDQRRPHREPEHDDEAEGPVVEDHVERDEREADEAGDQTGVQRVTAEGGRHRLDALLLELDRQGAVAEDEREVGRGLVGERAADLDAACS